MSINVNDKNLGHATAYAYYKAGGGTMTEAEFTEFMADFGTASQTAVEAAQAALASKNAAQTAATTATNKASEATTAATTATTKAAEAQADADAAALDASQALSAASTATTKASEATTAAATAVSAKDDAVSANTAAQSAKTAAQTAQAGAETAAASVESSAAQIATNTSDINELKEDLTSVEELTIKEESITETNSIKSGLTWTDGYYMNVNGTAQENSTYSYSSEIPVEEGDVISTQTTYCYFRFVTAYANGSAVSDKGNNVTAQTYTVPSGITSVIVTMETRYTQAPDVVIKLTHTEIVKSNIIDADVEALQSDVAEIMASIENIPTENLNTIVRTGHNYLEDISEEHENKYWNGSTIGSPISLSNNSDYVAVLLPITRHGVYDNPYNNMRFVHYLDKDKNLLSVDTSPMKIINATNESIKYVAITIYTTSYAASTIVFGDEVPYDRYLVKKQWVFEDLVINPVLHSYLPPEICVGVGRTIELYNNLVFLEADKYHLHWSCDVGVAYSRKFSIVGTDNNIGTYPLTLSIYNDELKLVKTLTSTVKVVSNQIESAINIVPIGDSLTNCKAWLPAVKTLSNDKIIYIGTRGNNGQHHEGRSGASAAWYNANSTYTYDDNYVGNSEVSESSNPFWDGTKFSLTHYINTQASIIGTPDAIQLLLGTNGMSIDPTATVNNIKTMVDNIIAEYPNMPIFVCNTIYRSNQDGYHSTGADGYVAASGFQFSEDVKVMNLQNALHDALSSYSNVYIVPLSVCMDRDNDFGQVEVPVNPRLADVTTHIASESVHPQAAGYLQMADVMYSAYIAHLT